MNEASPAIDVGDARFNPILISRSGFGRCFFVRSVVQVYVEDGL